MSKNVLRLPGGRPTAEILAHQVRELAAVSDNVDFTAPHFREQMSERKIGMRQVLDVLRHGDLVGKHRLDQYGDWRIKLKKLSAGRTVQVVVAVRDDRLTAITVI